VRGQGTKKVDSSTIMPFGWFLVESKGEVSTRRFVRQVGRGTSRGTNGSNVLIESIDEGDYGVSQEMGRNWPKKKNKA